MNFDLHCYKSALLNPFKVVNPKVQLSLTRFSSLLVSDKDGKQRCDIAMLGLTHSSCQQSDAKQDCNVTNRAL